MLLTSPVMQNEGGGTTVWDPKTGVPPTDFTTLCTLDPGPNPFSSYNRDVGGDSSFQIWISEPDGFTNKRPLHRSYVTATPFDPKPAVANDTVPLPMQIGWTARYYYNRTDFSGQPEIYRADRTVSAAYSSPKTNPFGSDSRPGWRPPHSIAWEGWFRTSVAGTPNFRVDATCNDRIAVRLNGTIAFNSSVASPVTLRQYQGALPVGQWMKIEAFYAELKPVSDSGCRVFVFEMPSNKPIRVFTRPQEFTIGANGQWKLLRLGAYDETGPTIDTTTTPTPYWPGVRMEPVQWEFNHGALICGNNHFQTIATQTTCTYYNFTTNSFTWHSPQGLWGSQRYEVLSWTDRVSNTAWCARNAPACGPLLINVHDCPRSQVFWRFQWRRRH